MLSIEAKPYFEITEEGIFCDPITPVVYVEECEIEDDIELYSEIAKFLQNEYGAVLIDEIDIEDLDFDDDIAYETAINIFGDDAFYLEEDFDVDEVWKIIEKSIDILNELEKVINSKFIAAYCNLTNQYVDSLKDSIEYEIDENENANVVDKLEEILNLLNTIK